MPALVAAAVPRLLANRGVLRAVLAEAAADEAAGGAGRAVIRGLYTALEDYVQGQMVAGRLRQMEPLAAVHLPQPA